MSAENKNLWAPWRMEYIQERDSQQSGCFLCDYWQRPDDDAANLVLWRTGHSLVVLNKFPYTNGHVLIAPGLHVPRLDQLPEPVLVDLMRLARDIQTVLSAAFGAQGFNLGANLGQCAGAGVPDHLHLHVVPRWSGDTNYMAVLGDVRVIPQSLKASYAKLKSKADELGLPLPPPPKR